MRNKLFWILIAAGCLGLGIGSMLFGTGGCGTIQFQTGTTSTTGSTTTLPPVTAQIDRELLFVASGASDAMEISVYSVEASGNLSLTQTEPVASPTGDIMQRIFPVIHPSGKLFYIQIFFGGLSIGDPGHTIIYSLDPLQGKLTLLDANATVPDIAPSMGMASQLVIDPAGKYAYLPYELIVSSPLFKIANGYNICLTNDTSSGLLTLSQSEEIAAMTTQSGYTLLFHPSGAFAYIISAAAQTGAPGSLNPIEITTCTVDTAGLLTPQGTATAGAFAMGDIANPAIDPTGAELLILEPGAKKIVHLTIDPATGLPGSSPETLVIDDRPVAAAFYPSGRLAYILTPASIYLYSIEPASHAMSFIKKIDIPNEQLIFTRDAISIAVDPAGKFAYVLNSGTDDIFIYSVAPSSGDLAKISEISTEHSPQNMIIWGK